MSSEAKSILYMDKGIVQTTVTLVKFHPIVIFQIADQYERRSPPKTQEAKDISVGLLYGEKGKSVQVFDSVPLLLDSDGKVKADFQLSSENYHKELFPNESLLGWYVFGNAQFEFPSLFDEQDSSEKIHLWIRPTAPPKFDVFTVYKSYTKLVSTPVPYIIDATNYEHLCLSRLADSEASGSLQAALSELVNLLKSMGKVSGTERKDLLIGRKIFAALGKTHLTETDKKALQVSLSEVRQFIDDLDQAKMSYEHAKARFMDKTIYPNQDDI